VPLNPKRRCNRSDKITQREYLDVFAKTGHDALQALLVVSCGSAVSFLALLGVLLGSEKLAPLVRSALPDFQSAISLFIYSIMCSLLAYVLSFISHASFYLRLGCEDKPPQSRALGAIAHGLTGSAVLVEMACLAFFMMGGFQAARGLSNLVTARL